jgi:hypothetical protein
MEDLTNTILELPPPGLIPVVLLLLVGLVLWVAGRRVLRTGFAAAGLIFGGVMGWAAGGLDVVAQMQVPAWVFAAVAAVVAALIFAAAYRLVLAAVIALLLAALAPLSVWTAAEMGALPMKGGAVAQEPLFAGSMQQSDADPATDLDRWLEEVFGTPAAPGEETEPVIDEQDPAPPLPADDAGANVWVQWWTKAKVVFADLVYTAWKKSPDPLRWSVVAAAAVGGLLGLVLGAGAPAISAAVVTALGGSGIMLTSSLTLATRVEALQGPWMPSTPTAWLAWWVALAVIGLGIQWMLRTKRADKPAS